MERKIIAVITPYREKFIKWCKDVGVNKYQGDEFIFRQIYRLDNVYGTTFHAVEYIYGYLNVEEGVGDAVEIRVVK